MVGGFKKKNFIQVYFVLGSLEKVLDATNKTVEYKKDMLAIELVTEVEFRGSTSLKDLHILVTLI